MKKLVKCFRLLDTDPLFGRSLYGTIQIETEFIIGLDQTIEAKSGRFEIENCPGCERCKKRVDG